MTALSAALQGFGLSLGLIVALGPQNAFVIRQGLLRSHVRKNALVHLIESPIKALSTRNPMRTRGFEHVGPVFLKMWRAVHHSFCSGGMTRQPVQQRLLIDQTISARRWEGIAS